MSAERSSVGERKNGKLHQVARPAAPNTEQHRKEQLEFRMALGLGKPKPDDLVFCNYDGTPISPNSFSVTWGTMISRAALPDVTFHACRHSHASALIPAGIDVVSVSRRLGHSSPVITLGTYAHLFQNTDTRAAEAIEKVLKRSSGANPVPTRPLCS